MNIGINIINSPGHIHYFSTKSLKLLFENKEFLTLKIDTVGMTHVNRNFYWHNKKNLAKNVIDDAEYSIKNSVSKKTGEYLQALFKYSMEI